MKSKTCFLYVNTRNGYQMQPKKCESIRQATKEGKAASGFYYRITDENGRKIKGGFCE